jgi:hypothetical protein
MIEDVEHADAAAGVSVGAKQAASGDGGELSCSYKCSKEFSLCDHWCGTRSILGLPRPNTCRRAHPVVAA